MRHTLKLGEEVHQIWLARGPAGDRLLVGDTWHALSPHANAAVIAKDGDTVHIHLGGRAFTVGLFDPVALRADAASGGGHAVARAPMPGSVLSIEVTEGAAVEAGDALVVIESMKMETTIRAPRDGTVATVHVGVGDTFERDAALVTLADEED
jgi:acetyl/propionyl-CoA carboxylase alpha subunit